jgi:hypothetical protein
MPSPRIRRVVLRPRPRDGRGGLFEYAIDLYLDGLKLDPGNIDVHKELREVSLRRKAAGGRIWHRPEDRLRKPQGDPVWT